MTKHCIFIDEACNLAKKSVMVKQHGCVLVHNGNIVGKGYNKPAPELKIQRSIHAEVAAICDAKTKMNKLNQCTLYVVRVSNGRLARSLPCEHCEKFIKKHEIPIVFFS